MGVKNYALYKVTEHAKERIQSRFNITKSELDTWLTRLLSQSIYVETQENHRKKYRLNDVVLIVDTKQRVVVTVYSENEHDDINVSNPTNPEVKSAINNALRLMIKQRKVKTANKALKSIEKMNVACQKMNSPYANYRFTDHAWDELVKAFTEAKQTLESGMAVIKEAQRKIDEG